MNKIDRDRNRNKKGSTAFDIVKWNQIQDKHHKKLIEYFLPRAKALENCVLSKWEKDFISGLFDQIVFKGRPLTTKQAVIFDKICCDAEAI